MPPQANRANHQGLVPTPPPLSNAEALCQNPPFQCVPAPPPHPSQLPSNPPPQTANHSPPPPPHTHLDPQRVRMSSGKRPIGAAKGKQPNTEALCPPPPPSQDPFPVAHILGTLAHIYTL